MFRAIVGVVLDVCFSFVNNDVFLQVGQVDLLLILSAVCGLVIIIDDGGLTVVEVGWIAGDIGWVETAKDREEVNSLLLLKKLMCPVFEDHPSGSGCGWVAA